MTATYPICHKQEIPENTAKGFSLTTLTGDIAFFIVHKNNQYFAYVNSCPHTHINLEWSPNQFLDKDNALIQCSLHGAKFIIENGYCIFGPCAGEKLEPLDIQVEGDMLQLLTDDA